MGMMCSFLGGRDLDIKKKLDDIKSHAISFFIFKFPLCAYPYFSFYYFHLVFFCCALIFCCTEKCYNSGSFDKPTVGSFVVKLWIPDASGYPTCL